MEEVERREGRLGELVREAEEISAIGGNREGR
jgi:hypothetical protein